jgi:hypothetical protein
MLSFETSACLKFLKYIFSKPYVKLSEVHHDQVQNWGAARLHLLPLSSGGSGRCQHLL